MLGTRDITLKPNRPKDLLQEKHESYLRQYANDDLGSEQIMAEYLKMSGIYWGLNALYLMKALDDKSPEVNKTLETIRRCQNDDGGFAAALRHDSHILHTLSAIQLLVIFDKCREDYIDIERCVKYIQSLQQDDGSFFGDKWGETDTRFSFCALATLKLLNRLDAINLDKAIEFVQSCRNDIDGGYGPKPGSESHTAYVYCCVGSIALADKLDLIDTEQLSRWLSERQLPSGGLNGRPEKLPDLCYSWWCLASLKMINRTEVIDKNRLLDFILACQDEEAGGFSDRPGNWVDPYHTMFGFASISLICHEDNSDQESKARIDSLRSQIKLVNPILCLPQEKIKF